MAKYSTTDDIKVEWTEKMNSYSDIESFEKDFVFAMVTKKAFSIAEPESIVGFKSKVESRLPTTNVDDKNKKTDGFEKMRKQFKLKS